MKHFPFVVLILIASFVATVPRLAEGAHSSAKDKLIQIERDLAAAWPKGDKETIDRILAPDWSVTNALGQIQTKEEVMRDAFQSGNLKVRSAKIDDVQVRLFGNAAIVTGRSVSDGLFGGKPFNATLRFTDVFVKRKRHWQVVASHASVIQQ